MKSFKANFVATGTWVMYADDIEEAKDLIKNIDQEDLYFDGCSVEDMDELSVTQIKKGEYLTNVMFVLSKEFQAENDRDALAIANYLENVILEHSSSCIDSVKFTWLKSNSYKATIECSIEFDFEFISTNYESIEAILKDRNAIEKTMIKSIKDGKVKPIFNVVDVEKLKGVV